MVKKCTAYINFENTSSDRCCRIVVKTKTKLVVTFISEK